MFFFPRKYPYLEDGLPGLGYVVVNNHGDRCCPLRIGLWDPLQMAVSWLINGGDPNYLLTGMILQVGIQSPNVK